MRKIFFSFLSVYHRGEKGKKSIVWISIDFNADLDPDPAFYLNAVPDPDLGSREPNQ
jgi:hypothetical protein